MLQLKAGVRVSGLRTETLLAILVASQAYELKGHECVVTSCIEGRHRRGSLHYVGQAVDFRTAKIPARAVDDIVNLLRESLGSDYDVVSEKDHIHVEFQPKDPLV